MFGHYNQILTIDLTTQAVAVEPVTDELLAECSGGKGLAVARFAPNTEGYRKPGAVSIGPAGEKLVKAIVFQGDKKRTYAAPEGVAQYAMKFSKKNIQNQWVKAYKAMGTTMMVSLMNSVEAFPAKYWSQGSCEHWEKISGEQ